MKKIDSEYIWVSNTGSSWHKRILVEKRGDKYVCVDSHYEPQFRNKTQYKYELWKYAKEV